MGQVKRILKLLAPGVIATALALPGLAGAQMYRWVDENGQVHYGDRIPPKYAKKQRDELNTQGVIIDSKARERTAEEIAAEQRAAERAEQAKLEAAEQARYDRYLITTYSNVREIIDLRDARLATLDNRLALAQESATKTEATLTKLLQRRERLEADLKDVPDKLQQQISNYETGLIDSLRVVRRIQTDRSETQTKFQSDIERYLALTNLR